MSSRRWWWLALALIASILLWRLSPILMPFAIAALLAYLGNPLVERLAGIGVPRRGAAVLVFTAILAALCAIPLLAFPLVERQIAILLRSWPGYLEWFYTTATPWLEERAGVDMARLNLEAARQALMDNWQLAGGLAARVVQAITSSWLALLAGLVNLVLVPVLTFYLLRDWDRLLERIIALLPRDIEPTVTRLARECDAMLATFLRGQLWVMVALGAVYATGLWLVGLDLALLIGIAAGAVSFVPYLGLIVGLAAAGIAGIVQFADAGVLLWIAAVFAVGQLLESFVLTPLLVGDRIGLHPVAVIFAVLAGGQLFGAFGVLLALPVAAVAVVLLRHAHALYLGSGLYEMAPPQAGEAPEVAARRRAAGGDAHE